MKALWICSWYFIVLLQGETVPQLCAFQDYEYCISLQTALLRRGHQIRQPCKFRPGHKIPQKEAHHGPESGRPQPGQKEQSQM